jgi:hypothetical protein
MEMGCEVLIKGFYGVEGRTQVEGYEGWEQILPRQRL